MLPAGGRESGDRVTGSLSVGVVLGSGRVPAWQVSVVERVAAAGSVEMSLFETGAPTPHRSGLIGIYDRLDYRHYRLPKDARAEAQVPDSLRRAPLSELARTEVDVVLRLSPHPVECAARFGVWSVRDDDTPFLAVQQGRPVVDTVLELSHPELGTRVIYRSASRTEPLSPYRNRNLMYWKAAEAMVRRLETLRRLGFDALRPIPGEPAEYVETPVSLVARQVARVVAREIRMRRRARRLTERWLIAHRRHGDPAYAVVEPPGDRFYADPFVVARDGGHHLFFEDYREADGKGVISHIRLDAGGHDSEPRVALERPYHLSYPFVFEAGGETWMVPETAANRTIELYRAKRFPLDWELERVLVRDVHALDTTVLWHDARFWLFTLVNPYGLRANSELHLYWSPSLDSEWTPHPLNPVVSDVRSARPAGRVQRRDGELVRLGQDSGERYGHAIALSRIELLTEADYREVPVGRMTANAVEGSVATHTYDSDGTYEVVDALRATTK